MRNASLTLFHSTLLLLEVTQMHLFVYSKLSGHIVIHCLCFWFPGVCISHWRGRGGWRINWHRGRGGHAQLICSHSDGHHHQWWSAVDGAAHSHLLRGTRTKRHGLQHHDAACCFGSLWPARPKLFVWWMLHPTKLWYPWPIETVSEPSPWTGWNGEWGPWWHG